MLHKQVVAFLEMLSTWNCPDSLVFDECQLELEDIKAIATGFQSGKIKAGFMLGLARNGINSEGLIALAEALISDQCPIGLDIDLNHNWPSQLQTQGVIAMANA